MNYFDIYLNNSVDELGAAVREEAINCCGPQTGDGNEDEEYSYCLVLDNCPLNGLFVTSDNGYNVSMNASNYSSSFAFDSNFTFYLQRNITAQPVIKLYMHMSPPCYNKEDFFYEP